jgi:hypothetical protein
MYCSEAIQGQVWITGVTTPRIPSSPGGLGQAQPLRVNAGLGGRNNKEEIGGFQEMVSNWLL